MDKVIDEKTEELVNMYLGQAIIHLKMAFRALNNQQLNDAANKVHEAYEAINSIEIK